MGHKQGFELALPVTLPFCQEKKQILPQFSLILPTTLVDVWRWLWEPHSKTNSLGVINQGFWTAMSHVANYGKPQFCMDTIQCFITFLYSDISAIKIWKYSDSNHVALEPDLFTLSNDSSVRMVIRPPTAAGFSSDVSLNLLIYLINAPMSGSFVKYRGVYFPDRPPPRRGGNNFFVKWGGGGNLNVIHELTINWTPDHHYFHPLFHLRNFSQITSEMLKKFGASWK